MAQSSISLFRRGYSTRGTAWVAQGRKQFFFEKKNQKTFIHLRHASVETSRLAAAGERYLSLPLLAVHTTLPARRGSCHRAGGNNCSMVQHAATATAFSSGLPGGPSAFAALDLGTNNCRLLVGAPAAGGFRVLDSFSRIVRLGEGLHASGRLSTAAMDRAVGALHACAARLRRRPMRAVRAIATEACRRAVNGVEFLARVRAETGIAFDIITPREEAELALESCAPLLAGGGRRALLFDIGGGSTELAWVRLDAGRLASSPWPSSSATRVSPPRVTTPWLPSLPTASPPSSAFIASAMKSASPACACSAPAGPSQPWPAWRLAWNATAVPRSMARS
jgi:hypothetical protein